jgi:hypothetical protein
MKEKCIVYKKFTVYRTDKTVYFANGKEARLLEIRDRNGNIIHRACQWGDYVYTLSNAKRKINSYIKNTTK